MKKRMLSLFLAIALLCSLLPVGTVSVNASSETDVAYPVEGGNIYFDKETGTITDCDSSVTSADIPAEIDGVAVTTIGDSAFYCRSTLTSVTIPDSITSVGSWAFRECDNLTSLIIGSNLKIIGSGAFASCSKLTIVAIPKNVTSIGDSAFSYCVSLTSVTIPDSVTTIGDSAFSYCNSLTGIWVDEANQAYSSDEWGVLFDKEKTELIHCPGGYSGDYTIPNSVTTIGDGAFSDCSNLTSVTIGDSITTIGNYAFYECTSLTSVTLPDSVTSIGYDAFAGTAFYNDDTNWENDVLYIGKHLVDAHNTIKGDYILRNNTLTIVDKAFNYCNGLTSITIPDSVTSIGSEAFYECGSLLSVTIGSGVTTIGDFAFSCCDSLAGIWVDEKNEAYSSDASGVLFDKEKTTLFLCPSGVEGAYTIPDGVTGIIDYAFQKCVKLKDVTIPNSVTSIGNYAFRFCSALTSLTIPDGVTSIGSYAFQCCENLINITIADSVEYIGVWAFNSTAYSEERSNWDNGVLYINQHIVEVENYLPEGAYNIREGTLTICEGAFSDCIYLTTVTVPDSVTFINPYAFHACLRLESVTIGNGIKILDERVFSWCQHLLNVKIPDSVTSIGSYAFDMCFSLSSITIPASVTSISNGAFNDCISLADVYYSGTEDEWKEIAIDVGNEYLTGATIHFNSGGSIEEFPEPSEEPTESSEEPSEPSEEPSAPSEEPSEPSEEPSEPSEEPSEPSEEPTEPSEEPTESSEEPSEPSAQPSEPSEEPSAPSEEPSAPSEEPTEPSEEPSEPSEPSEEPSEPTDQPNEPEIPTENPFADVKESDYFATPVLWAVGKNITNGMSATSFAPNANCTRGQIVTFLWRACGSPEPTKKDNPFTDVKADAYYYKAVLWAVENGITTGLSATTFGPNATCTRGQVATFLWRSQGEPAPVSTNNPFSDVKTSDYYFKAVLWAVENDVTQGVGGGKFAPNASCTRGQIVTFLYRAIA